MTVSTERFIITINSSAITTTAVGNRHLTRTNEHPFSTIAIPDLYNVQFYDGTPGALISHWNTYETISLIAERHALRMQLYLYDLNNIIII